MTIDKLWQKQECMMALCLQDSAGNLKIVNFASEPVKEAE